MKPHYTNTNNPVDFPKMNERIRELEQQCVYWVAYEETCEFDLEVYTRLIVKKCAGIIESQDVDPAFKLRMSWAVKEHFGVEE